MADFGIVCEFNPFHKGHAYLLDEARRRGADRIVCVMSGCAVQRGELAVADPYVRAEAALRCGADLVLQLPFPWCAASADYFATAGIQILSGLCDTVFFGSECGDLSILAEAARRAETEESQQRIAQAMRNGQRAAVAYADAIDMNGMLSSNDLLGVAYLRAIHRLKLSLDCQTIKRQGGAYRDETLSDHEYPSATAIRKSWQEGLWKQTSECLPPEAEKLFCMARERGELTDLSCLDRAILTFFRLHEGKDFDEIAEAGGGIANRICAVARQSRSADEFFDSLRTKQYTDAKLRRAMLFCMTGISKRLLQQSPTYSLLLGAGEKGRCLLSERKKMVRVPIVTKPADAPKENEQWQAECAVQSLFTLARPNQTDAGALFRKGAIIL